MTHTNRTKAESITQRSVFQFSLSGMLYVVTMIAILMGVLLRLPPGMCGIVLVSGLLSFALSLGVIGFGNYDDVRPTVRAVLVYCLTTTVLVHACTELAFWRSNGSGELPDWIGWVLGSAIFLFALPIGSIFGVLMASLLLADERAWRKQTMVVILIHSAWVLIRYVDFLFLHD